MVYLILHIRNLFLWRHFDNNPFLLLRRALGSDLTIETFSERRRSQILVAHMYADAYDAMLHFST